MENILRGVLGLCFFIALAYLVSGNKKSIDWKLVGIGVGLQILFGVLVTNVEIIHIAFEFVGKIFVKFLSFSINGAEFLFGSLADHNRHSLGFIFAFEILPTIIFFSTVSTALYYLGILQKIVYGMAWVMSKTMRLSGAESLSAAGNIFLGQTEAPMLVKPFIKNMTKSELMCLMTGGMATMAGGVLAAYVSFLGGNDVEKAQYAAHLLAASIMNAPAGIVIAKMLIPESEPDKIDTNLTVNRDGAGANLIDAMARGASDGLKLAANVGGMLLAFIAVIYFLNYLFLQTGRITMPWGSDIMAASITGMTAKELGIFGDLVINVNTKTFSINEVINVSTNNIFKNLSFEYTLGQIFRPIAWIMGVNWTDSLQFGSLLGVKTAINEFLAYDALKGFKNAGSMSQKSIIMATYALCGFANFSSIAIQIGGIGGMAPSRQGDLSKLGFKALFAAAIACMMTGTVAGMLF